MKRTLPVLVLALCVGTPLLAAAQPGPGPDGMGPPPELRAKLDGINAQAKADGYAALSPDHRAKVAAIVAGVTAGSLEPRVAAQQIDALLTADEQKAVLAISTKTRAQMRAAFDGGNAPPPPEGGPPGGGPPGGGPPPNGGPPPGGPPPDGGAMGGRRPAPTAGGFFLRVSITPEQMRALRANRQPGYQSVPPPTVK